MSAFQEEADTDRIGPMVGTLESISIIEVSAFQGCPQSRVSLYTFQSVASFRMSIQSRKPYSVACRATTIIAEMLHLLVITELCKSEDEG